MTLSKLFFLVLTKHTFALDMLFIGPNDLASSMGYVAFDHASTPEVQEASQRVLQAANDAGKYAGYFALDADAGKWSTYFACSLCQSVDHN